MEEFKIIKLPTNEDEDQQPEEPIKDKYQDGEYAPPKKRHMYLILFVLIVIVSLIIIKMLTKYEDYETEKSWDRNDSVESTFYSFNNNLLKYSADGVFYISYFEIWVANEIIADVNVSVV